jgi:hypothetical protein
LEDQSIMAKARRDSVFEKLSSEQIDFGRIEQASGNSGREVLPHGV